MPAATLGLPVRSVANALLTHAANLARQRPTTSVTDNVKVLLTAIITKGEPTSPNVPDLTTWPSDVPCARMVLRGLATKVPLKVSKVSLRGAQLGLGVGEL
jgi:hypothetical protein